MRKKTVRKRELLVIYGFFGYQMHLLNENDVGNEEVNWGRAAFTHSITAEVDSLSSRRASDLFQSCRFRALPIHGAPEHLQFEMFTSIKDGVYLGLGMYRHRS